MLFMSAHSSVRKNAQTNIPFLFVTIQIETTKTTKKISHKHTIEIGSFDFDFDQFCIVIR